MSQSDVEIVEIRNDDEGDSDCEIQPGPEIPVVELVDSDDEGNQNEANDGEDGEEEEREENDEEEETDSDESDEGEVSCSSEDEAIEQTQTNPPPIQQQQQNQIEKEEQTEEINVKQSEEQSEKQNVKQSEEQSEKQNVKQSEEQLAKQNVEGPEHKINNNDRKMLFRIYFNDQPNFLKLKSSVESALYSCLKQNGLIVDFIESQFYLDIRVVKELTTVQNENQQNTENEITTTAPDVKDGDVSCNSMANLCFEIDATPQAAIDRSSIPSYKRSIREVLNENAKKQKLDTDECTRPKANTCFNCLGNHSLKDCREPRNPQRINKNRKAHAPRAERYHREAQQRFSHLKPGEISENLRRALGLRNGELPVYIYKMRSLGYPPGWLEEAKIPHSGLTLFDSEGHKVLESDEEDGEVEVPKYKYDIEKIISFPGYNVHPGPNYIEDHKYYGAPPMLSKFRKEEFIKSLGDDNILKGYKRKKFKNVSAANAATCVDNEPEDMEIENPEIVLANVVNAFLPPPLPEDPAPPLTSLPPPPPPPLEEENDNELISVVEQNARDSPSLAELEEKQKLLLEALQNSSSILDLSLEEEEEEIIDLGEPEEPEKLENPEKSEPQLLVVDEKNNDDSVTIADIENAQSDLSIRQENVGSGGQGIDDDALIKTPNATGEGEILNTPQSSIKQMLGTPLLKFSPFDKLPSGDKFANGVSDVINFENLADSTGKYEQMKQVLKKVRNVIKLNMND